MQLTSTGPNPLGVSIAVINLPEHSEPPTPANFGISANNCPAQLPVGQSCEVSVVFTPQEMGAVSGILSFVDNASDSPQSVPLTGTGVVPVTLTPPIAHFGENKATQTFTLTNFLPAALTGIEISTTGSFAVSATTCGTSLGANQSCTISVTFTLTPTGTNGPRTGQLIVTDSAITSPQTTLLLGS